MMMTKENQEELDELLAEFFTKNKVKVTEVIAFFMSNLLIIIIRAGYSKELFYALCSNMIDAFDDAKKEYDEKQSKV